MRLPISLPTVKGEGKGTVGEKDPVPDVRREPEGEGGGILDSYRNEDKNDD